MTFKNSDIDAVITALGKHGRGSLNPSEQQLRALLSSDLGGPLQFINMLSFHDIAQYDEDNKAEVSGEDAYNRYGAVAIQHVMERGGKLFTLNSVEQTLIGADDDWHQIIIVQYPNVEAFIDMLRTPTYQAALHHRDAGLKKTKLLVSRPLLP
ncbi:DUF1330 domain-containing protein [Zhongshania sp. BJYM1]|uniref:DUF1330 domain-containing protein n=1 Tax=Zhongshania aquatica TaxID=2965069 RepID=UPI0022B2E9FE|nr:DUF1330 domain-containing protein [Marortus sp. BJYM1]